MFQITKIMTDFGEVKVPADPHLDADYDAALRDFLVTRYNEHTGEAYNQVIRGIDYASEAGKRLKAYEDRVTAKVLPAWMAGEDIREVAEPYSVP